MLFRSPGAAAGKVVFTADEAKELGKGGKGERVILVRLETSPEDIEGMHAAQGILTVRGGMTSHAAVVARGMGTCCVSGCGAINIDEEAKVFTLGGYTFREGDYISLDGSTGKIYKGDAYNDTCPLQYFNNGKARRNIEPETSRELEHLLTILAEKGEDKTFAYIRRARFLGKKL